MIQFRHQRYHTTDTVIPQESCSNNTHGADTGKSTFMIQLMHALFKVFSFMTCFYIFFEISKCIDSKSEEVSKPLETNESNQEHR